MGPRVKSAALLLFLFLGLLLLQAGCLGRSPSPGGTEGGFSSEPARTSSGSGIQDSTPRGVPKVSLSDALAALPAASQEAGIDVGGLTLAKVWGYGVDSSGLARAWVLGMQGEGRTVLLTYSGGQLEKLDLPTALPQGEVKREAILSPEDLFRKDMSTIVREMNNLRVGECDLVLDEGSYQVIIRSATESKTLTFDARTGELMASP
jgi:hypothetical protein